MSDKPLISFDYAIKYLLKNKGDYEIVEGFISALLAVQGYKPVKINALLESESNKEARDLKKSIADLVVQDEDGNKYIVEIERNPTPHFLHKAHFNSSRLVIDSISGNQDYTTIKKVFHISLLYFYTSDMKKPIYHGKTIIHEVDTAHPMEMLIANQGLVMFRHENIFPEYFFISVPLFNEVIHQELDEWLYMMKHSEVREDFKSPYMKKVMERLTVLKMNDTERAEYYKYLKEVITAQDALKSAELKGEKKGRQEGLQEGEMKGLEKGKELGRQEGVQEGVKEGKLETARAMLKQGFPIDTISLITSLSKEELSKLSK